MIETFHTITKLFYTVLAVVGVIVNLVAILILIRE
ncbi:hypothetical protein scyTo_0021858, partial [Scyliorhinus torazame]|nr:hypothetical protein [Scyliorhinus torazame]